MEWKKRAIGTLAALIVLILLAVVKCTAERPKPVSTETHVDSNGNVVIYEQYGARAGQVLDPGSYAAVIATSTAILAASCNFHRRRMRLTALKNRCTASVPAVVTAVRSGKTDGHLRYKHKVYNATNRYEYLGISDKGN